MKEKAKIKIKINGEIVKSKFRIQNIMLTKAQAKKKEIEQDYITYIIIKVKERVLFEFHLTERISKNPMLKFKCKRKELQRGDEVTMTWKTLLGKTESISSKMK